MRAGGCTNCVGHRSAQFGEGVAGVDARQTQHGGRFERDRRLDGVWPLLLCTATATTTQGGSAVMAVASGARSGVARSLPLIGGMAIGLGLMVAAAGSGLGALLLLAPALQTGLPVVGTAYLLLLAWRIARSGAPSRGEAAAPAGSGLGLVFTVQNPKARAVTLGAAGSVSGR
jgi:threonine/homoserine/homoserine lactone efflux protein